MDIVYTEDFTGQTPGLHALGWTDVNGGVFRTIDVGGNIVFGEVVPVGNHRAFYTDMTPADDMGIRCTVIINVDPANHSSYSSTALALRALSDGNSFAYFAYAPDSGLGYFISFAGGGSTNEAHEVPLNVFLNSEGENENLTDNPRMRIAFQIIGRQGFAKMWREDVPEPPDWTIQTTENFFPAVTSDAGKGVAGLVSSVSNGKTGAIWADDIEIFTGAIEAAPANIQGLTPRTQSPFDLYWPSDFNGFLIFHCKGRGDPWDSFKNPYHAAMLNGFLEAGYAVVTSGLGTGFIQEGSVVNDDTATDFTREWGSERSLDAYEEVYFTLLQRFSAIKGVCGYGQSMGGLGITLLLARRKVDFTCILLTEPVLNPIAVYDDTGNGFSTEMRAAHGATDRPSFVIAIENYNPLGLANTAFDQTPFLIISSPDDTVIKEAQNTVPFEAKYEDYNPITRLEATGQHGDVSHEKVTQAVAFFDANRTYMAPIGGSGGGGDGITEEEMDAIAARVVAALPFGTFTF